MKTATVADLRNHFRRVLSWIESGETVQILKRGQPFAQLSAAGPSKWKGNPSAEETMARLKEIWGDRMFTEDEVREMRELERENDLG